MKKLLILALLLSPLCLEGVPKDEEKDTPPVVKDVLKEQDEELNEILMKPHEEHYGVKKLPEIPPPVGAYKDA